MSDYHSHINKNRLFKHYILNEYLPFTELTTTEKLDYLCSTPEHLLAAVLCFEQKGGKVCPTFKTSLKNSLINS